MVPYQNLPQLLLSACLLWASATVCAQDTKELTFGPNKTTEAKNQNALDRIAIVVNRNIITQSELNKRIAAASQRVRLTSRKAIPADLLRSEVINVMINEVLEREMAQRNQVRVSEAMLDNALENIARRNKITLDRLKTEASRQGLNYAEFREEIKRQIQTARLRDQITANVQVTKSEIDDQFRQDQISGTHANQKPVNQMFLRQIVLKVTPTRDDETTRAQLLKLATRISNSEEFASLARTNSEEVSTAAKGGEIGWVSAEELPSNMIDALKEVGDRSLSDPIRTPLGWHLIWLESRREGTLDQEGLRQIAREKVFRRKAAAAWQEWQDLLRNNAYIEIRSAP